MKFCGECGTRLVPLTVNLIDAATKPGSQILMLWHTRMLITTRSLDEADQELLAVEKIQPLGPDVQAAVRSRRAMISALRGKKEEALAQIKGDRKDYLYPYPYLMTNPFFANLRGDPRFQEIVRKEEAKYQAKLKKYGDL